MEKKDYKDTLNLPVTGFPMKASLPKREPEMLKKWEQDNLYARILDKNRGGPAYILHDGPPYANGNIHLGHALNKVLKDIIVKYKSMKGFYAPYVPGWDCHGLPIELQVDKKLGKKKKDVSIGEKRLMCRQYAEGFIDVQREEFKRLGVLGDWDNPYITMSFDYEGRIVAEFLDFFRKGYAYVGKKPVHWCPSCVTALAEAEVEHADKTSPSVFVKFRIEDSSMLPPLLENNQKELEGLLRSDSAFIVIWTTTPWTLPANKALAVNANIDYALVSDDNSIMVVALELVQRLKEKKVFSQDARIIGSIKGKALLSVKAIHPFVKTAEDDGLRPIIEADFVSTEEGSGIVHIAPGHGQEDYEAGLREGLDVYAPVNDYGKFSGAGVEEIENLQVFKANPVIIDMLRDRSALLGSEEIGHSYPHCWRCKKPVIFRATEQWFISMEHEGLRERSLSEVEKVEWVPAWGKERIHSMIKNRPDWCISRQRSWGVPIAVFRCEDCGELIKDEAVLKKVIDDFTALGADIWFTREAHELLPDGFKCPSCGKSSFRTEKDILDVWFDSGVSFAATLIPERGFPKRGPGEPPADMYLEGSDQHRGWFQSSMLASVGTRGHAPYRTVLTHGYTVDGKGKKMSKSIGNVGDSPQDLINKSGADILRLWVSAEDYRNDIRISNEIMSRLGEAYRKIRNTAKYMLGNIHDFDGRDYSGQLTELDRWAMSRLNRLIARVTESYESYSFHEVYHRLYNFCVVDMSNFYLDILKDRLYTFSAASTERRAAQWVLREILTSMTGLMAPVLSFTAEEIWGYLDRTPADSVLLSEFPVANGDYVNDGLEEKWAKLISVRDEVLKALETKRRDKFIGNSLEAMVTLHISDKDLHSLISGYVGFLPTLFIVSQAALESSGQGESKAEEIEGLSISVSKAQGGKCQRCWNYSITVGDAQGKPEICSRCAAAIK